MNKIQKDVIVNVESIDLLDYCKSSWWCGEWEILCNTACIEVIMNITSFDKEIVKNYSYLKKR